MEKPLVAVDEMDSTGQRRSQDAEGVGTQISIGRGDTGLEIDYSSALDDAEARVIYKYPEEPQMPAMQSELSSEAIQPQEQRHGVETVDPTQELLTWHGEDAAKANESLQETREVTDPVLQDSRMEASSVEGEQDSLPLCENFETADSPQDQESAVQGNGSGAAPQEGRTSVEIPTTAEAIEGITSQQAEHQPGQKPDNDKDVSLVHDLSSSPTSAFLTAVPTTTSVTAPSSSTKLATSRKPPPPSRKLPPFPIPEPKPLPSPNLRKEGPPVWPPPSEESKRDPLRSLYTALQVWKWLWV